MRNPVAYERALQRFISGSIPDRGASSTKDALNAAMEAERQREETQAQWAETPSADVVPLLGIDADLPLPEETPPPKKLTPEEYEKIRKRLEKTQPLLKPEFYRQVEDPPPAKPSEVAPTIEEQVKERVPWLKDNMRDLIEPVSIPNTQSSAAPAKGFPRLVAALGMQDAGQTESEPPTSVGSDGSTFRTLNAYMDPEPKPDIDLEATLSPAPTTQQRIQIVRLPEADALTLPEEMAALEADGRRRSMLLDLGKAGAMFNEALTGARAPVEEYDKLQQRISEPVRRYMERLRSTEQIGTMRQSAALNDPASEVSKRANAAFAAAFPQMAQKLDLANNPMSAADLERFAKGPLKQRYQMDKEAERRDPNSAVSVEARKAFKASGMQAVTGLSDAEVELMPAETIDAVRRNVASRNNLALGVANLQAKQTEAAQASADQGFFASRLNAMGRKVDPNLSPDALKDLYEAAVAEQQKAAARARADAERKKKELAKLTGDVAKYGERRLAVDELGRYANRLKDLLNSGKTSKGGAADFLLYDESLNRLPFVASTLEKMRTEAYTPEQREAQGLMIALAAQQAVVNNAGGKPSDADVRIAMQQLGFNPAASSEQNLNALRSVLNGLDTQYRNLEATSDPKVVEEYERKMRGEAAPAASSGKPTTGGKTPAKPSGTPPPPGDMVRVKINGKLLPKPVPRANLEALKQRAASKGDTVEVVK